MICKQCGIDTPRLRLRQRYCPTCEVAVEKQLRWYARIPRWPFAKDLTGWLWA